MSNEVEIESLPITYAISVTFAVAIWAAALYDISAWAWGLF